MLKRVKIVELPGAASARDVLGDLAVGQLESFVSLSLAVFRRNGGPFTQQARLVMRSRGRMPEIEVEFVMDGVKQTSLRNMPGGEVVLTGFDILDVSDRQLEGIKWLVEDCEDGLIEICSDKLSVVSAIRCS